jgi:hypothetical protein
MRFGSVREAARRGQSVLEVFEVNFLQHLDPMIPQWA